MAEFHWLWSRKPNKVSEDAVNTSLLEQELAPLHAQIEQTEKHREKLEQELRGVEAELEKFSAARQRFDALQDVCNALDKLGQLKAEELFWKGIPGVKDAAGHLKQTRERVAHFERRISGIVQKQATLQAEVAKHYDELDDLAEEVDLAHAREQRRQEEFVVEREISAVPFRAMVMPWTKQQESEKRFRRAVLVAFLFCFVFGTVIPIIEVPLPDRTVVEEEIPKRLAKLVKKVPPKPAPPPKPEPQKAPEEPKKPPKEKAKPKPKKPKPDKPPKVAPKPKKAPVKVAGGSGNKKAAARKKAERVGVLAFKKAFAELMDETKIAKLGTEARIRKGTPRVAGQAVAQRSLVAIQAKGGSSGGINNAGFSRNVGTGNADQLGGGGIGKGGGSGNGSGFEQVESGIAGIGGSDRPLSDDVAAGRTDEEIQIVFDRYKATLYRIYNRELRKDPTLKGKMLLRISIETDGSVSLCQVESTDLASPELVDKIVARIKRFNFGYKEGVPQITILYPIDFLPAA
jgi:outer membrane biosynthesis protein TonB